MACAKLVWWVACSGGCGLGGLFEGWGLGWVCVGGGLGVGTGLGMCVVVLCVRLLRLVGSSWKAALQ